MPSRERTISRLGIFDSIIVQVLKLVIQTSYRGQDYDN